MSTDTSSLSGPDLGLGVPLSSLPEGAMLQGHAGGEAVLLIRRGGETFALGAFCTHYGAPLVEGLLVDDTIRCPWHHACFNLRTGGVLRAPARDPLPRWRVEEALGVAYVREKLDAAPAPSLPDTAEMPGSVVIVGGGVAGNAAAETLRREGYAGRITMLSADRDLPCDRPNLSKNYLAGTAPEDWIPLRSADFYRDNEIDVHLDAEVTAIHVADREVVLADGSRHSYDALLLATGAHPVRLDIPGAGLAHVHYLRTFADGRNLVAAALTAKRAVIIGASFIGLEVAASLRARDIEVHVVEREAIPMAPVLGPKVGAFIRAMHEDHGVTFHLGTTASAIDEAGVTLANGERVDADLVVIGIGVRPETRLAKEAGLAVDRGVTVDEYLQTSAPNIFAAGDIARWPDPFTGESVRFEHFVVAERQGEAAARNIMGRREPFDAIPFFWTEQYDLGIAHVGHGAGWDEIEIDGDLEARDCAIAYRSAGRKVAVALIHRDLDGLRAELEFERSLRSMRNEHEDRGGRCQAEARL
jgi:NADPH-dependent 2,4-dienoyl-CoA reductase/sulfur reductase-like enzyme/nitrite reductase/ring-hydroxylating ferredoxin subunit